MGVFDDLKTILSYSGELPESAGGGAGNVSRTGGLEGRETQFGGAHPDGERITLVVGLDFGTAFTKVVVGESRMKIAIPLTGDGSQLSDYLLPSRYRVEAHGSCELCPQDTEDGVIRNNLKMPLIEGRHSTAEIAPVSVFLALVFRQVRAYLFKDYQEVYEGKYIDWLVNVGLPTDSYHDDEMVGAYRKAVSVAWMLSSGNASIKETCALELLEGGRTALEVGGEELADDEISAFPEFVAQLTGYVRSFQRDEGLHALVDIGAGTMDITTFNVFEIKDDNGIGGENTFPIFAKRVEPNGTRYLTRFRLAPYNVEEEGPFSPFRPVPSASEFADLMNVPEAEIRERDSAFRAEVVRPFFDILRYTRERRYPLSPRWRDGLPVFLCGGGAGCDFYSDLFGSESLRFQGTPLVHKNMPMPTDLEWDLMENESYNRVSVAYGLAFDPDDIGEIQREDEIEDAWPQKPTATLSATWFSSSATTSLQRKGDNLAEVRRSRQSFRACDFVTPQGVGSWLRSQLPEDPRWLLGATPCPGIGSVALHTLVASSRT